VHVSGHDSGRIEMDRPFANERTHVESANYLASCRQHVSLPAAIPGDLAFAPRPRFSGAVSREDVFVKKTASSSIRHLPQPMRTWINVRLRLTRRPAGYRTARARATRPERSDLRTSSAEDERETGGWKSLPGTHFRSGQGKPDQDVVPGLVFI